MKLFYRLWIFFLLPQAVFAQEVLNIYAWGGEIPHEVIEKFEQESGIKVNFSTYDNNETMYARLKASRQGVYDIVLPSSYYVERMRKQNLLQKLENNKLTNSHNLDPEFIHNTYDPDNQYSIPLVWGVTGIFYNKNQVKVPPENWETLWDKRFYRQLLLLDDPREIFSAALLSLHLDPNTTNHADIDKARDKLLTLIPNIKLFASDSIASLLIDEEAIAGIVWNGDAYRAHAENPAVAFVYPRDGFTIWVDCLAIPHNAPHPAAAHKFINFMLRPEIAMQIALHEGYAITNAAARKLLPPEIRNNYLIYPDDKVLQHAIFQRDTDAATLKYYNKLWEEFKLAI